MQRVTLLLVLLLGFLSYGEAKVYGLVYETGGQGTQTILAVVDINITSGKSKPIAETTIYVGPSITLDGISTFDQKNQILYYATDYDSAFVFGVAVTSGDLRPPISVGAEVVESLDWDQTNNQLLIHGIWRDKSQAVVTYPANGPSKELVNFTDSGITTIYSTAVDNKKGVYYFASYNESTSIFEIGSFAIAAPKTITKFKFACGGTAFYAPNHLFFDSNSGKLLGIGYNETAKAHSYFEIIAGKCTPKPLALTGIVVSAAYDPTTTTLYLGYASDVGAIIIYDTTKHTFTQVTIEGVPLDVQVSFPISSMMQ